MRWRGESGGILAGTLDVVSRIADGMPIAHAAAEFSVSCQTAAKWWRRFRDGDEELPDRASTPGSTPHRTDPAVEAEMIDLRRRHGSGAATLVNRATMTMSTQPSPGPRTACAPKAPIRAPVLNNRTGTCAPTPEEGPTPEVLKLQNPAVSAGFALRAGRDSNPRPPDPWSDPRCGTPQQPPAQTGAEQGKPLPAVHQLPPVAGRFHLHACTRRVPATPGFV